MANRVNRYSQMYAQMPRPNVASTFPRHVFLRAANFRSDLRNRIGNRENCFQATLLHLTERFHGRDVYLVGTTNQSTMLAQRTKKLIEELQPDAVYVQTSSEWWNAASQLQFVDSQDEMNKYNNRLSRYLSHGEQGYMWWPGRTWLQMFRLGMYSWLWRDFFRISARFDLPGLEIKYACEAAEKVGAKIHFMGADFDDRTCKRMTHETRMTIVDYVARRWQWRDTQYIRERWNNSSKYELVGPSAFSEKCMDQHLMNWYTAATATFFPQIKRICIDEKDQELFNQLDEAKGQKIVVVVN